MSTDVLAVDSTINEDSTALAAVLRVSEETPSVDSLRAQWLHAKRQRSQSERTVKEYAGVLDDFRAELSRVGLDLDAPNARTLGALAQAWAARARARDGRAVASATHNRRLAILSSFYIFGKKHGMQTTDGDVPTNPVELVERARVQAYAAARPLPNAGDALARIDRTTLAGKRDYALLLVAISTGRRVSELAALRAKHLTLTDGELTITWERTKGGKTMQDTLADGVTDALLAWLSPVYGVHVATLAPDAPLWLALSHNAQGKRQALTGGAIADVCQKHLGTTKVHATRHTFAVLMERAGAKLTDIQARLGHSNAATTGVYMQQLHAAENAYADGVAALLGVHTSSRR